MKPTIAIVGCGKVGTSLGVFLHRAGYPIAGTASRTPESAKKAAELIGIAPWEGCVEELTRSVDVVLLSTPDDAISKACSDISAADGFDDTTIVLHCSGALPSTLLSSAAEKGAAIGSMHPLQAFASIQTKKNPFEGIIMAIEGNEKAVAAARGMAEALGATAYTIKTEGKTLYHAAAVVASNYMVTVVDQALALLETAGIERTDGMKVLAPLLRGTLNNLASVGSPTALTGPIERGDVKTVGSHLEQMTAQTPDLVALYKHLGRQTVAVAEAKGTLTPEASDALKKLLG